MYWNRDYRLLKRTAEDAARRGESPEHVLLGHLKHHRVCLEYPLLHS